MSNVSADESVDDRTEIAEAVRVFEECRRRLFGVAYRMLGSVADAEDVLQDVWIRWQGTDRSGIREPIAFLTTITTRLSINALQSAHTRRETYIGPWLPEPVNTEDDPLLGAERGEALQFAILILLEKLSPTERAAYVLREAFDYEYDRVAEILQTTQASARQLVSRARKHLASEKKRSAPEPDQRRFLEAFLAAAQRGETSELEALFSSEVGSWTDGNGVKLAARIPVLGRERVAKFVAAFSSHFWLGKEIGFTHINGQPAATLRENGVVTTLLTVTADEAGITRLLWVMSPGKLEHVEAA